MFSKGKRRFSLWRAPVLFFLSFMLVLAFQPTKSSLARPEPGVTLESPFLFSLILSDGQFVYGPNVKDFELEAYLRGKAPHLLPYFDSLFFWSLYPSINPKVLLTLIEARSGLVTAAEVTQKQFLDPLRFSGDGFDKQLEELTRALTRAYYWYLLNCSSKAVEACPELRVRSIDGTMWPLPANMNAATFAIAEALARMSTASELATILDKSSVAGFYQIYLRLFPDDDPLDDSNHIDILVNPPSDLLQLPYPVGESWSSNGVHDWAGDNGGSDMSAIDFSDGWPPWSVDTSNMWVVAAGPGTVEKVSNCWIRVSHSDGWTTSYYHLENVQVSGGSVSRNQPLANLADTFEEATCTGGWASGPHVHFALSRNGAYVGFDGTRLSGWVVHSGRYPYDTDCRYMYLEKDPLRKCAFQRIYNDGIPEVPGNLLSNASFEYDGRIPAPWKGRNLTLKDRRVCKTARRGRCSFRMLGSSARKSLRQVVNIPGSAGDTFTLRGWSKARNPLRKGGAYCLQARVFHTDGTKKNYWACFAKRTHTWQRRRKIFTVAKDYNRIVVSLLYYKQGGKAWFDDVRLVAQ